MLTKLSTCLHFFGQPLSGIKSLMECLHCKISAITCLTNYSWAQILQPRLAIVSHKNIQQKNAKLWNKFVTYPSKQRKISMKDTLYNGTMSVLSDFSSCYIYYAYKTIILKNYCEMKTLSINYSFGQNYWLYNFDS